MSLPTQKHISSLEMFPAIGILDRAECEGLLKRNMVGRLAFALHDHVGIVPVHYVYDEGWIYGRTEPGGKLVPILRNRRVAFEIDEHEGMFRWQSVVVQGALYLIDPESNGGEESTYAHALHLLRRILPSTFAAADPVPFRNQLFRIHVSEISGRSATLGGSQTSPRADAMRDDTARPERDALLRATVCRALAETIPDSASRVLVDVIDGVVILSGLAEDGRERGRIEREVLSIGPVKALIQQLDTAYPAREQPEPADIARAAVRALENLDARLRNDIKVVVENEWLRIEGTAESEEQRHKVMRSLRTVKGIRGVIDRIQIASGVA
jgi:hypothetical protein